MSLRICTLNVHTWRDADGNTRVDDVIAFLGGIACDVILLNEVDAPDFLLRRVADDLSLHVAFGAAQFAGNAILAREPLVNVRNLALPARRGETRAALFADVTLSSLPLTPLPLTIACTHLDHRREVARLEQLALVHAELARADASGRGVVVGGDFNALRLSDYAPAHLDVVRGHRAANHWEAPAGNVVARMDAWGYVDAVKLAHAGSHQGYAASLAQPLPPSLSSTCWAKTRIDHIWLSAGTAALFHRADAAVADIDVSDHRPVVVTLHPSTG